MFVGLSGERSCARSLPRGSPRRPRRCRLLALFSPGGSLASTSLSIKAAEASLSGLLGLYAVCPAWPRPSSGSRRKPPLAHAGAFAYPIVDRDAGVRAREKQGDTDASGCKAHESEGQRQAPCRPQVAAERTL